MYFHKLKTEKHVAEFLRDMLELAAEEAVNKNGIFRIGVSGGSVINFMEKALPGLYSNLDKFKIFFCDERYVPETDKESTIGIYKRALLPNISLTEDQFVGINTNLTLKECAQDYEERILKEFDLKSGDVPRFDLLVMGIGPDGHTCSLFPEHAVLKEKNRLIAAVDDSPKPPPQRVTMTLPLINNAKQCIFIACGEAKGDILKRIFRDKEQLPAGMVKPLNRNLHCLLDAAAAGTNIF